MVIAKFVIVVALAVTLSACGTPASTSARLTVNGHPVSIALYTALVAAERQKIERTGTPIDPASATGKRRESSIEASVIRELVRDAVVEQLAASRGITISAGDLRARVSAAEQAFGGPLAFEQALEQSGLSRNDFSAVMRYRLLEAQLTRNGTATSTSAIDGAARTAHIIVTVGPCADASYPACLSGS